MPYPSCGCGAHDEGLLPCEKHRGALAEIVARDNGLDVGGVLFIFEHEGMSAEDARAAGLSY